MLLTLFPFCFYFLLAHVQTATKRTCARAVPRTGRKRPPWAVAACASARRTRTASAPRRSASATGSVAGAAYGPVRLHSCRPFLVLRLSHERRVITSLQSTRVCSLSIISQRHAASVQKTVFRHCLTRASSSHDSLVTLVVQKLFADMLETYTYVRSKRARNMRAGASEDNSVVTMRSTTQ